MDKQRYMISDAAALVNVESHVLRYWEEELELTVPRNEMGHRYYTKENIEQFMKIKEWKEQGYQLKAIKLLIHNGGREDAPELLAATAASEPAKQTLSTEVEDNTRRMEQFQHMMAQIVKGAIAENNHALGKEVSELVRDYVLKEMNYLMREQDEAEEERYKKLDELIGQSLKAKGKKEKKLFHKKQEWKPNEA